jgi:hypothetical protein
MTTASPADSPPRGDAPAPLQLREQQVMESFEHSILIDSRLPLQTRVRVTTRVAVRLIRRPSDTQRGKSRPITRSAAASGMSRHAPYAVSSTQSLWPQTAEIRVRCTSVGT